MTGKEREQFKALVMIIEKNLEMFKWMEKERAKLGGRDYVEKQIALAKAILGPEVE